ncbi:MAG: sensor histidine kinase [Pseudonocardia sp.]|nr:sensor histidine kinase [Pseudonocardia sp.]
MTVSEPGPHDLVARPARHQGLLYSSAEELAAAAVPFLGAGISNGERVLAVLDAPARDVLADGLGADATQVLWTDPGDWYTYPAHALRRAAEFAAAGPDPMRMLGNPFFTTRSALEATEWARYEALINVAFPDTAVLCTYDTRTLDPQVLTGAGHTHPVLRAGEQAGPSATFVDTEQFLTRCDTPALPPAPAHVRTVSISGAPDLAGARRFTTQLAATLGFDDQRCADVATAVNEAVTNAIEHGGGHGVLRAWTEPTDTTAARLVIEVVNPDGDGLDPFAGHLPPTPHGRRGRGLWLIRQLADLVQTRPAHPGVVLRMHWST